MAKSNRRLSVAATLVCLLFLVTAGMARATVITVNTTDGGSDAAPLCTLEDAVLAANTQSNTNGCPGGNGNDTILFAVTGTILIDETLNITDPNLSIIGPAVGGITISGGGVNQIMSVTGISLKNLTLADGFAANGGAIEGFGNLFIDDCTFVGNISTGPPGIPGEGGAIFVEDSNVTIINSTFANNTALPVGIFSGSGGAIFNDNSTLFITNSTFSGNNAGSGAALEADGPTNSLRGTIFANSAGGGGNCNLSFRITDDNYNISDDASCGFTAASSLNSTNPQLGTLANNGGPTETFALLSGSPAINRIPVASCVDQSGNPLVTDQRLLPRPDALNLSTCDSGAYEFGAMPAPIVVVPNSEHLQIVHSSSANSDKVNLTVTFIEEELLEADPNALDDGLVVQLYQGTCAAMTGGPLFVNLDPFTVRTVNHERYGTLSQLITPETVSARMVELTPPPLAFGEWTLNLEVTGLDTMELGIGGSNPFALVLTDESGLSAGCFTITNAIVGNQIPPPPHAVRRGVRR
jgi:hypothetical protein